ncbi:unnamed protein product [Ambrosiozyma monospora]|uniref:Unnamed protein product n=1 Tax=Ambrosiozyma monospora TaxID=43982 RepID=A0A9W6YRL3_AMBMO|nr:unnamed protein product [Ambrosiozyma monospora]
MSNKQHQLEKMNLELERLQNNFYTMSKLTSETATQFEGIKTLGRQQASFFMSSHAVFQAVSEKKELNRQRLLMLQQQEHLEQQQQQQEQDDSDLQHQMELPSSSQ